ncbi:Polyketide cyclase / dehydrase and lipid transport [Flavobacterium fryxellicola]|uniref:Polyketide cyclase n=1 Tax=Flavobacterium fryxellicola TaxID=249352 RepID=A0A167UKT7_9FLAO|nr:SRPBCC family protein [Flavobacterium fryxellicola]OAB25671.1 hypothetical protein FBFR_14295 [Flavobacterium fryxellicola]SHN73940.1 Polyketide cyclase / dehydrase and lipid transport [Flavobacterium fryxellicola]
MIVIVLIAVAIIVLGSYLKNDYLIVREINVERPKQQIFSYIKLLRNQNEYSYYNRKDPNTVKSYSGTDGEVGFTYSWSSKINSIGTGTQTISKIIEGDEICCNIQFTKPVPLKSFASIALTEINEKETKVTWTFSSHYNFPLNVIIYFLNLEKLIGTDIATSLVTLKENLER